MAFTIGFYETDRGSSPVEEYLDALRKKNPKAYRKCLDYFGKLREHGVQLDSHYVEKIKRTRDVWELRPEWQNVEYRFLFGIVQNEYVMVWAGIEKGKLKDRDLDLAQQRIDEIK